jgi:threonine/homoserine/homoserine lactone efflux protein
MIDFILVVLILFLIPGPAVFLTITQTVRGGVKAGILTGAGIAVGDLIHTFAAVVGISAILMTSAFAFQVVKLLGAAYLIYLGISTFLKIKPNRTESKNEAVTEPSFRQAMLIELLNPKTALFFLSFLPQFVHQDGTPIVYQLLLLGLTFVLMSIMYTSFLAILSGFLTKKALTNRGIFSNKFNKLIGSTYIILGLHLFFQDQS